MKHKPKDKSKPSMQIPWENLMGIALQPPQLNVETMNKIEEALVPYTCKLRWEKWEVAKIKNSGTAILLHGASGCGKTTTARWMAKKVGTGFIPITMADFGGGDPGDSERNAKAIFDFGRSQDNPTIYIDECDGILWSRDKAGPDSMWMLTVVNQFLMLIEKYLGLIVLSTNALKVLDPALMRRLAAIVEIGMPDVKTRFHLWKQKLPSNYPITINELQYSKLTAIKLTGSDIELALIQEARIACREGRLPKFDSLYTIAKQLEKKPEK